jgi:hypothetical protein
VGVPVRQGKGLWGPYFDYPGTRWVYVQWCAPPLAPLPSMYFNWSVLIPPKANGKVPAELYFHPAGYSYAQPGRKMLLHSIQIAPHDYPASGWYGFSSAWHTLRSARDGVVSNHTQRRIIAFLDWAKRRLPIDPKQIIATGADGAAALALNFPDTFAYVRITGFDSTVLYAKAWRRFAAIWGPNCAHIKDERGRSRWQWAMLDRLALDQEKDLPLFSCLGASWGRDGGYARGNGRFYRAMQKARQPLIACWGWNGARNLGPISRYSGAWRGHAIARTDPVPAVSDSTRDHDQEQSGTAGGNYNWKDVRDEPEGFSITILGGAGTFSLTPRRLQRFKVKPNETLAWEAETLAGPRGETAPPQRGRVRADAAGLVTIQGLQYADRCGGLVIRIRRAR